MQTPPKPILSLKGYVTIWKSARNKKPSQVERAFDFGTNALKDGYWLYALAEKIVKLDGFEWKDRTIFADGWRPDPSVDLGDGKVWEVQVSDQLRAISLIGGLHYYLGLSKPDRAHGDLRSYVLRPDLEGGVERVHLGTGRTGG